MRLSSFLFALGLVAVLAFAGSLPSRRPSSSSESSVQTAQDTSGMWNGWDSGRMWRRAEIRVVPLDRVSANRAELQSFRERVAQAELEGIGLGLADPAIRRRQLYLMKDLLRFAERQESNQAEGPTAMEVQQRLNRIEGQVMCEACHSGIVARAGTSTALRK
ncbi:MAG: hypothetical protein LAO09_04830 [Acidobacteriia bacterium]|nr:hypothetical protein [Terriglobia bacterium]